jgi:hypothetical protein
MTSLLIFLAVSAGTWAQVLFAGGSELGALHLTVGAGAALLGRAIAGRR